MKSCYQIIFASFPDLELTLEQVVAASQHNSDNTAITSISYLSVFSVDSVVRRGINSTAHS